MSKTQETTKKALKQSKTNPIRTLIQSKIDQLGKALPDGMSAQRLARIAETAIRITPKLSQCDPRTLLACLFQSAQLGLEPNVDGQCYYLPFWNSKRSCLEAQFIIGYKGYANLFHNHESAVDLNWGIVKQGDKFDYEKGTESFLRHKYGDTRGKTLKYWVMAKLASGGNSFEVMSREECIEHGKKHSKCYDKKKECFIPGTPWATDSDLMCLKTVLIQLMKVLPKSVYLKKAIQLDETTKTDVAPDMTEIPDETDWNNAEDGEFEKAEEEKQEAPEEKTEPKEKTDTGKKPKGKRGKKKNKETEKNIEDEELDDNQKRIRQKAKEHGLIDNENIDNEEGSEGLFPEKGEESAE